jgi:hypothetical protein
MACLPDTADWPCNGGTAELARRRNGRRSTSATARKASATPIPGGSPHLLAKGRPDTDRDPWAIAGKIKNVAVSTIAVNGSCRRKRSWRRSFRPTRVPRSEAKSEAPNRPFSPAGRCSASRGHASQTAPAVGCPPDRPSRKKGRRTGRRPNSDWPGCRL